MPDSPTFFHRLVVLPITLFVLLHKYAGYHCSCRATDTLSKIAVTVGTYHSIKLHFPSKTYSHPVYSDLHSRFIDLYQQRVCVPILEDPILGAILITLLDGNESSRENVQSQSPATPTRQ